jgi:flagellar biosynthesis activator protein FlaF
MMMEMAMQIAAETMKIDDVQARRDLEAAVLNKAAEFLLDVQSHWHEEENNDYLTEVLKYNQRLWNLFLDEVVDDGDRLPDQVRQNILSLSIFIGERTVEVLKSPAPEKLDILIKINRGLAEGLQMH